MPRTKRNLSYTGIYHIIIRGINRENIFLDNSDKRKFLKEIKRTKEMYKYEILAYCLMNNHVHLLVKDDNQKISRIMQSINISYAKYFNLKYERVGHVFQNRFFSKSVETEKYLLTVQRYIHQNPEIANIQKTERYVWSSYKEYITGEKLCNTKLILDFFKEKGKDEMKEFEKFTLNISENNKKNMLEMEGILKLNDDEAVEMIKKVLNIEDVRDVLNYNKVKRDEMISKIKKLGIVNKTQLARILGVNIKNIDRAK